MNTKQRNLVRLFSDLSAMGFSYDESVSLRRISMTLHRWDESECGDGNDYASWCVERDETTGIPYRVTYPHSGKSYRTKIADREKGALRRLSAIMRFHPELVAYHQGDCRGAALYIVPKAIVQPNESIDSVYNRGLCVAA